jgi:hypothetical protein
MKLMSKEFQVIPDIYEATARCVEAGVISSFYIIFGYPARWRLDHDRYDFPLELWVNRKLKNIPSPPKPNVDAKPLEPATAPRCP